MVTLKDSDAATILRILEDIMSYDTRAACSDAAFRRHYRQLLTNPFTQDQINNLRRQLNNEH